MAVAQIHVKMEDHVYYYLPLIITHVIAVALDILVLTVLVSENIDNTSTQYLSIIVTELTSSSSTPSLSTPSSTTSMTSVTPSTPYMCTNCVSPGIIAGTIYYNNKI